MLQLSPDTIKDKMTTTIAENLAKLERNGYTAEERAQVVQAGFKIDHLSAIMFVMVTL